VTYGLIDDETIGTDADKQRATRRQELRRSNAAVPIPVGKHKKPRAMHKQALRQEYR